MQISYRIDSLSQLKQVTEQTSDVDCIVIGHESCPLFYIQQDVDSLINFGLSKKLNIKINIPIVFEEYLDFFKGEVIRLMKAYPSVKLILNDWGTLVYLHMQFPDTKFAVGLGMSFSYADCPWNFHIVEGELDKYKEMLQVHNFASTKVLQILSEFCVDEIIIGYMHTLQESYRIIKDFGINVTVNKNVNIVTISRACHTLRILGEIDEKGHCKDYCDKRTTLKGTHYFDMALSMHAIVSDETKAIQPEMISYANILFVRNNESDVDLSSVSAIIEDYRN